MTTNLWLAIALLVAWAVGELWYFWGRDWWEARKVRDLTILEQKKRAWR